MAALLYRTHGFARFLVFGLFLLLFALAVSSCGATSGGQKPFVGSVVVMGETRPTALVRYDLNGLVAWGVAKAEAEVYLRNSGIPILGPLYIDEHKAIVRIKDPKFEWEGPLAGPLPHQSRPWFRDGEIAAWGLHFDDEIAVAAEPDV